jgi:hydrogenase maturation protease
VIGVGNVYRSDDGVGIVVARRIREKAEDLHVVDASGEGASLMAMWTPSDHVVVIDAVRSSSSPGRIHRLDSHKEPIPSAFFNYSTHAFSVAEAVEMSRALATLPARLVIYGIEGRTFAAGSALSQEVSAVLDEVVDRVLADLGIITEHAHVAENKSREVPHA